MAFCEGSGLLRRVWLHPSRWPSWGMGQGTGEESHSSAPDPEGLQQKVGAEEGPGRVAGGHVGRLGSAGRPPSPADPRLTLRLPAILAHPWPHIPPRLSFPSTNIEKINSVAKRGRPRVPLHTTASLGSRAGGDPAFLSLRVNRRESKYWLLWRPPQPVPRGQGCLLPEERDSRGRQVPIPGRGGCTNLALRPGSARSPPWSEPAPRGRRCPGTVGTGEATWVTSWRVSLCRALAAVGWGHSWCAARAACPSAYCCI